jgi:mycoredoxin
MDDMSLKPMMKLESDKDASPTHLTEENSPALIVYGTPFCPMVGPVRRLLDEAGISYDYIDIRLDRDAAARVREITGGYESVPTLEFSDGRTMVEPGTRALRQELLAMGQGSEALGSPVTAVKAGLSNPVYIILALVALALLLAMWLAG